MGTSKGNLTSKNIKVREEQDEWLDENEAFNLSGFVREKLDEEMD